MDEDQGSTNLDFKRVAEAAAQGMKIDVGASMEDQRILDQIQKVGRLVAEHEMAVTAAKNKGMFEAARARREAEAELNRLLGLRINNLSTHWKGIL